MFSGITYSKDLLNKWGNEQQCLILLQCFWQVNRGMKPYINNIIISIYVNNIWFAPETNWRLGGHRVMFGFVKMNNIVHTVHVNGES